MSYKPTATDFQTLVQLSAAQNPPIDPVQVALVLFEESGFNPAIQNKAGASNYGLNQMSAANLSSLGLTPSQWTSMTAAQQLPYIFKWWASLASSDNGGSFPADGGELLALNFEPGAFKTVGAGGNPNAILAGSSGPYASNYTANSVLDPNKTGSITVNTCRQYLANVEANGGAAWAAIVQGIQQAGGSTISGSTFARQALTSVIGGLAIGGVMFVASKELERYRTTKRRRRYT